MTERRYDVGLTRDRLLQLPGDAVSLVWGIRDGIPYVLFSDTDPAAGGTPVFAIEFQNLDALAMVGQAVAQLLARAFPDEPRKH